jgi:hypothetical protein
MYLLGDVKTEEAARVRIIMETVARTSGIS